MEAIATHPETARKAFVPPLALRVIAALRGGRLRRLLRAVLEGMNAAPRDVSPEFFRYPFP